MKSLSVERQIAMLRPTAKVGAHAHEWLLAAAATCLVVAIFLWHPWPLMIAVFLSVVGFGSRKVGPNIVAAVAAYDSGNPTNGEVSISITCWDSDDHYHAMVREQGHPDWEYEFVPQGWQPASHSYPARIWRTGSEAQPILAAVEDGILIPRYEPRQVAREGRSQHA